MTSIALLLTLLSGFDGVTGALKAARKASPTRSAVSRFATARSSPRGARPLAADGARDGRGPAAGRHRGQGPPRLGRALMSGHLIGTGLTKRYAGLVANDGVDIEVRPGEIVGLIGPNGAGKTTCFNCLTGAQKLTVR